MTVAVFGKKTVGECVPAALSVNAKLLADIQVKLAAALRLQAHIAVTPPSVTGNLKAAIKIVESLQLRPPGVALSLAAFADVIAALNAKLAAALQFNVAFGASGVVALGYAGAIGSMGSELTASVETLFAPTNEAVALVLIASDPATKVAMELVFGVSF